MPKINTGYWVRVVDGRVYDVWDSAPDERPGWREAIEVVPDVIGRDREVIEGHIFDLEKTPVEIVYQKRPVSFEERQGSYISHAEFKAKMVERDQEMRKNLNNPEMPYDQAAIDAANAERDARVAALRACNTHDDLDALDA
jgi:hypothetical protein